MMISKGFLCFFCIPNLMGDDCAFWGKATQFYANKN